MSLVSCQSTSLVRASWQLTLFLKWKLGGHCTWLLVRGNKLAAKRMLKYSNHSCYAAKKERGNCAAESWQEMAAVLDMLQDMSEVTGSLPLDPTGHQGAFPRPASAAPTSPPTSQLPPRCASAYSPSEGMTGWPQSFASVPASPCVANAADDVQASLPQLWHPLSARSKSASQHSKACLTGQSQQRRSPLSASARRKQSAAMHEWQS